MSLHKIKILTLTVLTLALLGGGAGLWASRPTAGENVRKAALQADTKDTKKEVKEDEKQKEKDKAKAERDALLRKQAEEPGNREAELRAILLKTIDFNGFDDPRSTLIEALDQLAKIHRVTFDVNYRAFKVEQLNDVNKTEIASPEPIPPMKASLRSVLHKILTRVPVPSGATFLLRKDHIEITTWAAVRRELSLPSQVANEEGELELVAPQPPLIHESFVKEPLDRALARIAETSEVSVLIDPRLEKEDKQASTKITATLRNVPHDTAIEMLAEMAGLAVVKRANVYYVTTPENAERMRKVKR